MSCSRRPLHGSPRQIQHERVEFWRILKRLDEPGAVVGDDRRGPQPAVWIIALLGRVRPHLTQSRERRRAILRVHSLHQSRPCGQIVQPIPDTGAIGSQRDQDPSAEVNVPFEQRRSSNDRRYEACSPVVGRGHNPTVSLYPGIRCKSRNRTPPRARQASSPRAGQPCRRGRLAWAEPGLAGQAAPACKLRTYPAMPAMVKSSATLSTRIRSLMLLLVRNGRIR